MTAGRPVRLQIEDFELRSMTGQDAPAAFQRWASDPSVMGPMNLPARSLSSVQVAEYWGGFNNMDRFFLGIFRRSTGEHIGFWMIELNVVHGTATVYLAVDPRHQNQEVTFLTGIVVKDWLFQVMNIGKLIGVTLSTNARVIHAFERSFWTFEATLRSEVRSLNGPGRLDHVRYYILAEDWPSIRNRMLERWRKTSRRADWSMSLRPA